MSRSDGKQFCFVGFDFGFAPGPPDGSFVIRDEPDGEPVQILSVATLGAPAASPRRRGRRTDDDGPAEVPITRVSLIDPEPLADVERARTWLAGLRSDGANATLDAAARMLARAIGAHRLAHADHAAPPATPGRALAVRLGFGDGEAVAVGRFAEAWEPPRPKPRTKRSMDAPQERFAALLGGRDRALACEELVLRARGDLEHDRGRAAALQARIALEALLSEAGGELPVAHRSALEEDRAAVAQAANVALAGELDAGIAKSVSAVIGRMESALRARRLDADEGSASDRGEFGVISDPKSPQSPDLDP